MPQELIDEAMKRVLAKIASEMPNIKNPSLSSNASLPPNVAARTGAITGKMDYNPFVLQTMSPDERENTIAHEMTHVRQQQDTPFFSRLLQQVLPQGPYSQRSDEMEAFQAERDRSLRNHLSMADPVSGAVDIQLNRDKNKVPDFLKRKNNGTP